MKKHKNTPKRQIIKLLCDYVEFLVPLFLFALAVLKCIKLYQIVLKYSPFYDSIIVGVFIYSSSHKEIMINIFEGMENARKILYRFNFGYKRKTTLIMVTQYIKFKNISKITTHVF